MAQPAGGPGHGATGTGGGGTGQARSLRVEACWQTVLALMPRSRAYLLYSYVHTGGLAAVYDGRVIDQS